MSVAGEATCPLLCRPRLPRLAAITALQISAHARLFATDSIFIHRPGQPVYCFLSAWGFSTAAVFYAHIWVWESWLVSWYQYSRCRVYSRGNPAVLVRVNFWLAHTKGWLQLLREKCWGWFIYTYITLLYLWVVVFRVVLPRDESIPYY